MTNVSAPVQRGGMYFVAWQSTSAAGTWFQVYVNQQLAVSSRELSAWFPVPLTGPARIDIGTVLSGEQTTSFASTLPTAPQRRAQLSWQGGSFLGATIAGFGVYGSSVAGGAVNYTTALDNITAYPAGITTDGFGLTGFGQGGFGQAAGNFAWTSGPLTSGVWSFAIVPYDQAGNQGAAQTATATIAGPPASPAPFSDGSLLTSTVNGFGLAGGFGGGLLFGNGAFSSGGFGGGVAFSGSICTLTWLPSP